MKSGSMSSLQAATNSEHWCGGTPDDDAPEPTTRVCDQCDGKGFVIGDGFSDDTQTCGACGGSGRQTVDYPALAHAAIDTLLDLEREIRAKCPAKLEAILDELRAFC